MNTPWTSKVSPAHVWSEYPRPQLTRPAWSNLNGLWKYAITSNDSQKPDAWTGEILVPFAPESALSGVGKLIGPEQILWYERELPPPVEGKRSLLHFEAVDYDTQVFVNERLVGSHVGGHTPFTIDITPALKADGNALRVRVQDKTEGFQLHGKQKLEPGGIWYTRVTGIWQTVWLETVPQRYIADLDHACDVNAGTVTITPQLAGTAIPAEKVRISASLNGQEVASAIGEGPVVLTIPQARLWSPDSPTLYDLKVELVDGTGKLLDAVNSYTALREFGKAKDAKGNWRLTLNGKSIFHWGPLDQGWWPDGLLTPPSDEAMLSDIQFVKACGFNMIRKHIKIEPSRYYYHCDRLGVLVWQDQVSMGYGPPTQPAGSNPKWTRMEANPTEGRWPEKDRQQFVIEYKRMVDHLRDHPCIAVWVPFNEAWGQHDTVEVGEMAKNHDKTRAINIASGGNFWPVGDIADEHSYPDPSFPLGDKRFDNFVKVAGEFGGHGWPVKGHLWKENTANWGYGGLPKDLEEWKSRFTQSVNRLCSLRKQGIAGGVYTQTTDVEIEINGLLTYDRTRKIDPSWVKSLSDKLLKTPDVVEARPVLASSEEQGQRWRYTTDAPASDWSSERFDDSSWKSGEGGFGTRETPNTHVRTVWDSSNIWIRRTFQLTEVPAGSTVLRIYHDEDTEVFLNGKQIAALKGFNGLYSEIPIDGESLFKTGVNTLAIHCRQQVGGQYIDAGLNLEMPGR